MSSAACVGARAPANGAEILPVTIGASEPLAFTGRPMIEGDVMEAIWEASLALEPEKQTRLKSEFARLIGLLEDGTDRHRWLRTLDLTTPDLRAAREDGPNYALDKAHDVLATSGQDGFLQQARRGGDRFNVGRPEMLTAMALDTSDAVFSRQITELMRTLAQSDTSQAGFERADLAHGLTSIAMHSCQLAQFDNAVAMTGGPDSIRYALWRARITGGAGMLAMRIREDTGDGDTRPIRQAIEGYEAILEFGYCDAP
ncbi:MAG: hypothetical protein V3V03_04070 [Hyphomonadaceae bacterium]